MAVQRVAATGLCAAGVHVRLHYATTREGRTRQHGREELPTHLELDRHFQSARTSNCWDYLSISEWQRLAARHAVRLPKMSFDGDCFDKSAVVYTDCIRPWRRSSTPTGSPRLNCRVRRVRPLRHLHDSFGICDAALDWMDTLVLDRSTIVAHSMYILVVNRLCWYRRAFLR